MPELDRRLSADASSPAAQVGAALAALAAAGTPRRRLLLGVSGGVDSLLMLALLHEQAATLPPLHVVHVHHGLSPQADDWAQRVAAFCAARDLPCTVCRVAVDRRDGGLEAAARAARHGAFHALLQPGDALLLAHHADDQAETLLLRLLRGSGLTGLGAMRAARPLPVPDTVLWRPLLGLRRTEIVAEATRRGLRWDEDAANADPAHDRNFLRHAVLPALAARWPAAVPVLAATARRLAEADALLNAYLDAELAPALGPELPRPSLDAAVAGLPSPRREALLRRWLARTGAPAFSEAWLAQLVALATARADAEGELRVAGWEFHRHRGRLTGFPALPPAADGDRVWSWDGRSVLELGPGHGRLGGDGGALAVALPPEAVLTVRLRAGGERLAPAGGAGHRSLKKVLQELGVPPWLRARLPLLYVDGRLAAAGDRVVDRAFAPGPDRPATHRLGWTPPGGD